MGGRIDARHVVEKRIGVGTARIFAFHHRHHLVVLFLVVGGVDVLVWNFVGLLRVLLEFVMLSFVYLGYSATRGYG